MNRLTILTLSAAWLLFACFGRQMLFAAEQVAPSNTAPKSAAAGDVASEAVDGDTRDTVEGKAQVPLDDDSLDQSLERQLGEDVGMASSQTSLETIVEDMRRASQLLLNRDAQGQTRQLQEQVVRDLDDVIDRLKRRRPTGSGQSKNASSKSTASNKKTGSAPSGTSGRQAAADSKLGSAKATGEVNDRMGVKQVNQFIDEVWGQLPERVRERVSQKWGEEFLPKYELQIEEYYRRLAEEGEPSGP